MDRPIIFSAPMICALLDGRKTQDRRVLKPQPDIADLASEQLEDHELRGWWDIPVGDQFATVKQLPYAIGDRLWCKETFQTGIWRGQDTQVTYRATMEWPWDGPWRSPIFMPRKLSRMTMTVTDVRVQRLQEISEADAIAEGIEPYSGIDPDCHGFLNYRTNSADGRWIGPRESFRSLWNSLHSKPKPIRKEGSIIRYVSYPWENVQETRTHRGLPWLVFGNPWVVALTFDVQHRNIDSG